jgi:rhodanese-related sulfurtransferase/CRP-like cAMP-binding protein
MNRAPLISSELFDYLRNLAIEPYTKLGDLARGRFGDEVRVIPLLAGENLVTQKPGQRVTVLSGTVSLDAEAGPLDLAGTRERMVQTGESGTSLHALENAVVLLADTEFLDTLASWAELAAYAQQSGGDALVQRLLSVMHTNAFKQLPLEHVTQALRQMVSRNVAAGEVIVNQGERGDAFYLIWSGQAEVWQEDPFEGDLKLVDTMGHGDTFGDEALVTGGTRNATVKMIEDGELLVLGQQDFRELMSRPMIEEIPPGSVPGMIDDDWKVVDVRYMEEFEDGHIPEAIHLPLHELRQRADGMLDRNGRFITVCLSGKRSAVAAFLLKQRGYNVVSMKGGMSAWQGEAVT